MASYTPNLNLIKPADADSYDVANDNGNMDKIDAAYGSLNSKFQTISSGSFRDIRTPGIYYITAAVTDKPYSGGGVYVVGVSSSSNNYLSGFYTPYDGTAPWQVSLSNGTWIYNGLAFNSNSAEKKFDLFYAFSDTEGQGDISDALLINTTDIKGNYNRVGKIRGTTTNKPSDCQFGIRQVLAFSTNHYFLIIIGVDTTPKMGIWTNFYNSGSWEGWKRVTIT